MTEGLRKIPQQLAGGTIDLLGEKAKVVGEGDETVEQCFGALQLARLRQARH